MIELHGSHGRLEWFGGDKDALNMYAAIVDLLHIWDDLVDKDKPVGEATINHAFLIALVYLQANPFYRKIQDQIMPMWLTTVSAFETANKFERDKDEHGLEIAHILRFAVGQIVAYAIHVCVGPEKAREYVPEMWKVVANDRFQEYRKEHLDADSKQA
jgi:purine-cytosine permease-like protein